MQDGVSVWNEKMSITMCQIFIQPKLLISRYTLHTHIHTQIHRALACLHLSSFFDLTICTRCWIQKLGGATHMERKERLHREEGEREWERWIHARIMSSVDSLVCSIFYCWNDFCEARFFGMTKIWSNFRVLACVLDSCFAFGVCACACFFV